MYKNYKVPLVIGVTGHRDILEKDYLELEKKIKIIFNSLLNKYPSTPLILLSPLADGADRLVANVVLKEFKSYIDIKVILPFDEETYINTFGVEGISTKEKSTLEYESLKSEIISNENTFTKLDFNKDYYNKLENEKEKKAIRDRQYSMVGEYIAIHSHILLALENPKSVGKVGGTSEVVRIKLTGEYNYFGKQNDVSYPEKGLVYRVNTPRLKDYGSRLLSNDEKYKIYKLFPDTNKLCEWKEDEIDKYTLKDFKEHLFSKPCLTITQKEEYNSYRQQHLQINCLNKMIEDNVDKIEDGVKKDIENLNKLGIKDLNILKLVLIRRAVATISSQNQQKMKTIENILLFLIVLTTTIVLTKSIFPDIIKNLLSIFYPLIIVLFYIALTYFKKYKNSYEDTRAISEGLRVQIAWNMAKIGESVAMNYLSKQKDELNWIRSSLRGLNIFSLNDSIRDLDKVNNYWIEEQINYFSKNITKYSKIYSKSSDTTNILFILFLSLYFSFSIFSYYVDNLENIEKIHLAIPLILLAFFKSKQLFDGHDKIIKQYELSLDSFKRAKKLLSEEKTDKKEVLKNLGKEALFENSFWTILRREKNYKTPSL